VRDRMRELVKERGCKQEGPRGSVNVKMRENEK